MSLKRAKKNTGGRGRAKPAPVRKTGGPAELAWPLAFSVLAVLALAMMYSFFLSGNAPATESGAGESVVARCPEGSSTGCARGICNGTRLCVNGTWGACTLERTCEPGKRYPCTERGCSPGYRVCNSCGDGFGPCILPPTDESG